MSSVATIVLILLVVIAAVALVRILGGAGGIARPTGRPMAPRDRIVEREVERPVTQDRVVEREVVERDVPPERL